jgi:iron complex outermembrane receptor protein
MGDATMTQTHRSTTGVPLRHAISLLLAACPLAAGTAHAQSASSNDLGDVIVTAQKRSERVQDLPAQATVITAGDLETAGVQNIQDVATLTPNLVVIDQLRPGIQTVSFRGFTTVQGGQSPFAIVVDGVPQPGQEFLKQQLVDIQQIEVLRGPQGTLYGAGAIAGAINIVTKAPGDALEVGAKVGFAQGDDRTATFTLGGPLGGSVKGRVSAFWRNFGGLIDNTSTRRDADFANERSFAGELLFSPTERLDVSVRGRVTQGTNGALWLVLVTNDQFDDFDQGPTNDIDGIDERDLKSFSVKADYRFDPFTFTSISAYNEAKQSLVADGDFSAASVFAQTWENDTEAWSQEFRLTSPSDGPLVWNAGAFVQNYEVTDVTDFFTVGPGFSAVNDNVFESTSFAVFGQASYEFATRWTATAGVRYDRVKAEFTDRATADTGDETFKNTQPKATLSYKWNDDVLGYVTYSKGFRTGGFNPDTPLTLRLYDNETASNYEAGLKTSAFDNRLIVNAAVFHTDFKNQQFFFSQATNVGIFRAIVNIPETKVNGAEIEVQARPLDSLRLMASAGYNDTEIDEFVDPTFNGKRTPQVYNFTGTLSAEYSRSIGSGLDFVARADWNHRGPVYWDLANALRTPSKDFINARIALNGAKWSLAAFARNLTSERTPAAVGANAFGPGLTLRSANSPKQIGVEFEYRL